MIYMNACVEGVYRRLFKLKVTLVWYAIVLVSKQLFTPHEARLSLF